MAQRAIISFVNSFQYAIEGGEVRGAFNVYQGRNGFIYLLMGNCRTKLSKEQINELCIDVYSLIEFDFDLFTKAYN